jgi:Tol biopolymer transport system component
MLVALLAVVFAAGCRGGTAPPSLGTPVAPARGGPQQIAVVSSSVGRRSLLLVGLGGSARPLPLRGPFIRAEEPAWFPDGRRLVFTGDIEDRHGDRFVYTATDLFAASAGGRRVTRLTSGEDARMASVSPDGGWIAFVRTPHQGDRPFTTTLWLMRSDGSDQRRLFDDVDGRIDTHPAWSPDGTRIAFTRCRLPADARLRPTPCSLWVAAPDGSGARRVARHARDAAWSHDGTWIAFVSDVARNGVIRTGEDESEYAAELYRMHPNGSHRIRITHSPSLGEASPAWSRDGRLIAYALLGSDYGSGVHLIRPDGSCDRPMLTPISPRTASWPAWRPRAGRTRPAPCTGPR